MYYQTSAGTLEITLSDQRIQRAIFIDSKSQSSFKNQALDLSKIAFNGTPFQIKVWQAALAIPEGQTRTYHEVAQSIGQPKAYRAVANALGQNKIAYFIPCHRVIRKDGSLGGYKWGIEKKKALLEFELNNK
jgi:AraC family transcriptional regulator of adaptative response/methylated-DNA-[protein]-cysteine methyltransferase